MSSRLFDNDVRKKVVKSTPSVYRVKYRQKLGLPYYLMGLGVKFSRKKHPLSTNATFYSFQAKSGVYI
jgi:hypothetical protein